MTGIAVVDCSCGGSGRVGYPLGWFGWLPFEGRSSRRTDSWSRTRGFGCVGDPLLWVPCVVRRSRLSCERSFGRFPSRCLHYIGTYMIKASRKSKKIQENPENSKNFSVDSSFSNRSWVLFSQNCHKLYQNNSAFPLMFL